MKLYTAITISVLLLLLSLSLFLLLDINKSGQFLKSKELQWETKEKESISRYSSVPILLYHDIDGKGVYSLTHETIMSHFQFLKENNIKVIKLSELIKRIEKPAFYNDKVVVISFDDGFLSMYTKLLPIIKEFGYPITIFVYTNNIFTKAENNITWAKLRKMEEYGVDVECHSMSHPDIEELSNDKSGAVKKRLFQEIYLSKRIIELYMNKTVNYFAFPYGRYNLKLIDLCRISGYNRVFSTAYRSNIITRDNYCLGRGHIKNDYSIDFVKEIIK